MAKVNGNKDSSDNANSGNVTQQQPQQQQQAKASETAQEQAAKGADCGHPATSGEIKAAIHAACLAGAAPEKGSLGPATDHIRTEVERILERRSELFATARRTVARYEARAKEEADTFNYVDQNGNEVVLRRKADVSRLESNRATLVALERALVRAVRHGEYAELSVIVEHGWSGPDCSSIYGKSDEERRKSWEEALERARTIYDGAPGN